MTERLEAPHDLLLQPAHGAEQDLAHLVCVCELEQRRDPKRIDARADVWSLGAILYEMLCGRPPEDFWRLQIPEIPQWDTLSREMLSLDPAGRPADATVVLGRLPPTDSVSITLSDTCRQLAPKPAPVSGDLGAAFGFEEVSGSEPSESSGEISHGRRFEVGELIGSGGFGEVYRATMHNTGGLRQDVAIKFLRNPDPGALVRLAREGELLASLRHPSILKVHDLVRLQGQMALVTEYVAGMDLSEALKATPKLSGRAVFEIVGRVAEALQAASMPQRTDIDEVVQLVHRDIKPSNIRVGVHEEVKLLDFGVAWAGNRDSTHGDSFIGSIPYMAPERLRRERAIPASDIYGLGCVLYEGLAGRPLHEGRDIQDLFTHVSQLASSSALHERFIRDALDGIEVSDEVRALLGKMLSHAPSQRPDAGDVASACDALSARVDGAPLKQWFRAQDRPTRSHPGPLTGRVLQEASRENPPEMPRAAPVPEVSASAAEAPARPRASVIVGAGVFVLIVALSLVWGLSPRQEISAPPPQPRPALVPASVPPDAAPRPAPTLPPPAPPPAPAQPAAAPPAPVAAARPKPAAPAPPEPAQAARPDPEPAVPGRFGLDGEFRKVELRNASGERFRAGEVPAGYYSVYADFGDGWDNADLEVSIAPGQRVVVHCNDMKWICQLK